MAQGIQPPGHCEWSVKGAQGGQLGGGCSPWGRWQCVEHGRGGGGVHCCWRGASSCNAPGCCSCRGQGSAGACGVGLHQQRRQAQHWQPCSSLCCEGGAQGEEQVCSARQHCSQGSHWHSEAGAGVNDRGGCDAQALHLLHHARVGRGGAGNGAVAHPLPWREGKCGRGSWQCSSSSRGAAAAAGGGGPVKPAHQPPCSCAVGESRTTEQQGCAPSQGATDWLYGSQCGR